MKQSVVIVGLGEAGTAFTHELRLSGQSLHAYDTRPRATETRARSAGIGIPVWDPSSVSPDVVLSVVPGSAAADVARAVIGLLAPGALYIDCAAKSVQLRDDIFAMCTGVGVHFCDASIMDTVSWGDSPIRVLLSGPGAVQAAACLKFGRLAPSVADPIRCVSTEAKLCRSIFTKGVTALLFESLGTAQGIGIYPLVKASVDEFMSTDFQRTAHMLLTSTTGHSLRRAYEVQASADLVRAVLGTSYMAEATGRILERLSGGTPLASGSADEVEAVNWSIPSFRSAPVTG